MSKKRSPAVGKFFELFRGDYHKLWLTTAIIIMVVSIGPLITISVISYHQYQKTFREEMVQPIYRVVGAAGQSISFFVTERKSALQFVIKENSLEELSDQKKLKTILRHMKQAFGDFVDIGVIDANGVQLAYVGPHKLLGSDYTNQGWFKHMEYQNVFVSDVFMGLRHSPHFAIVIKNEKPNGQHYMLRATVDIGSLNGLINALAIDASNDAFLVNTSGQLQTKSDFYGQVLTKIPLKIPRHSSNRGEIRDEVTPSGESALLGYVFVENTPFLFMVIKPIKYLMRNWIDLRIRIFVFLVVSVLFISVFVLWISTRLVSRIKEADVRRAEILHEAEYTNKMISLGRLAAGVAHEINNPLAIINEKAGFAQDLVEIEEDFPRKETFSGIINSILGSVERCSKITHRLLGFAKHMDTAAEDVHLDKLIEEVLGFLEKEAEYRNINVSVENGSDIPPISSDRGQLQQVFLNITNNAFAAVKDGGSVSFVIETLGFNSVSVSISDDGPGISEVNLERIFEPFFTTKEKVGTGLGLSITYGIVEKLGGQITVDSTVDVGTTFTVALPIKN